jgi:hypothetical protein
MMIFDKTLAPVSLSGVKIANLVVSGASSVNIQAYFPDNKDAECFYRVDTDEIEAEPASVIAFVPSGWIGHGGNEVISLSGYGRYVIQFFTIKNNVAVAMGANDIVIATVNGN